MAAFDFSAARGITKFTVANSNEQLVEASSLAPRAVAAISNSSSVMLEVGYTSPTAPVIFTLDGGTKYSTITNFTSGAAPTAAVLNSTGAANGVFTRDSNGVQFTHDANTIASLTINAAANLVVELNSGDYTAGASLIVQGAATSVKCLENEESTPFASVNVSGLSVGHIELFAASNLTRFVGGGGGGNELLYNSEMLSASATSINGGGAAGNVISAEFINTANSSIFTNWQTLNVTGLSASNGGQAFDAGLLGNDAISGVGDRGLGTQDTHVESVVNLASNANVTIIGDGVDATGLTLTHLTATGNTSAVTFENTAARYFADSTYLGTLTSTGDSTVSIASTSQSGGGYANELGGGETGPKVSITGSKASTWA